MAGIIDDEKVILTVKLFDVVGDGFVEYMLWLLGGMQPDLRTNIEIEPLA